MIFQMGQLNDVPFDCLSLFLTLPENSTDTMKRKFVTFAVNTNIMWISK